MLAAATPSVTGNRALEPRARSVPEADPRRRPEDGHAVRLGQQGQTQLGCEKVGNAHSDGKSNWPHPWQELATRRGRAAPDMLLQTLHRHLAQNTNGIPIGQSVHHLGPK